MKIFIFILLGVLAIAGLVVWVIWHELNKLKKANLQFKAIADKLNGHCVDHGTWAHPLIIVDHEGLRTRISLEQTKVFDQTGTSMLQVKQLKLTTDGYDPQFKMSVVPGSFTVKANAWVKGHRTESGRADFDSKFVIASNRFHDSMNFIISPDVARKVLAISRFEPTQTLSGVEGKTSSKGDVPAKDSLLERKRKNLPALSVNLKALTNQINKQRFRFSFEEGKSHFQLLVHESEIESLTELVLTMVYLQRQVASNVMTLEKTAIKKPGAEKESNLV